jgi:hypothetical protein
MKRLAAIAAKARRRERYSSEVADALEQLREDLWFVESGAADRSILFKTLVAKFLEKKE